MTSQEELTAITGYCGRWMSSEHAHCMRSRCWKDAPVACRHRPAEKSSYLGAARIALAISLSSSGTRLTLGILMLRDEWPSSSMQRYISKP